LRTQNKKKFVAIRQILNSNSLATFIFRSSFFLLGSVTEVLPIVKTKKAAYKLEWSALLNKH